jgi:hypothetical protein
MLEPLRMQPVQLVVADLRTNAKDDVRLDVHS